MDASIRSTNLSIPKRYLIWGQGIFLLLFLFQSLGALAAVPQEALHWAGKKTLWDRKTNKVHLIGDASLNKQGENLKADQIILDLEKRIVRAKGRCVYMTEDTLIHSNELYFNIDTGAGTVIDGQVTNGKFLIVGERINRLEENRFQAHHAEYTTCHDCPGSISFEADDVDIEFGGYAYMSNVIAKIKGTPVMWIPYMILPVKTSRQTGMLFPKIAINGGGHGFIFVPQFFWATGRSTDMTIGLGIYGDRGFRGEWEGRYVLSETSGGVANFFFTNDKKKSAGIGQRWGLSFSQWHQFPLEIEQKLRFHLISDNLYPFEFHPDVPGVNEPVLTSDLIISKSTSWMSGSVAARMYRNLLFFSDINPTTGIPDVYQGFDQNTVQLLPRAKLALNDVFIGDTPIAVGFDTDVSHFWRKSGAFDRNCEATNSCTGTFVPQPGVDPIRKATRFAFTPKIYSTIRPWDLFSIVPSIEFHGYTYQFQDQIDPLFRGYLLFQAEFSLELEKIFDLDDPSYPRAKHLIRPNFKYSRIPYRREPSGHPFIQQIATNGYNFDNYDIVAYSRTPSLDNYFVPLGHSLSYGVTTQLIRRNGSLTEDVIPSYQTYFELSVGQTLDLLQLDLPQGQGVPLTRFYADTWVSLDKLGWSAQYYYYPFLDRLIANKITSPHEIATSFSYLFENESRHGIIPFQRSVYMRYNWKQLESDLSSISMGATFSISDYIMPRASMTYNFLTKEVQEVAGGVTFHSPAQCWKIDLGASRNFTTVGALNRWLVNIDFKMNLTGEGFDTVGGLTKSVTGSGS